MHLQWSQSLLWTVAAALLLALSSLVSPAQWSPRCVRQRQGVLARARVPQYQMSHGKQAAPPIGINGNLTSNCPVLPAVPEGCLELQHVCFDQAAVVLHGKDLQPSEAGAPRSRLPSWIPQVHANFPYPSTSNPDYMQVPDLHLPQPLLFRPVSQYEPSQELADPQVSVPVLL